MDSGFRNFVTASTFWPTRRTCPERVVQTDLCPHLSQLIDNVLDEREAEILRLRYGLNGDAALTQRETARRCGISPLLCIAAGEKGARKLKKKTGRGII